MKHIYLSLCLCLISLFMITCFVNAQTNKFQTAVLLLKNGESKTGLVANDFQRSKTLRFKAAENAAESSFELTQIEEVRMGDTERFVPYCSADAAMGCQWLVTLLDGKVRLYRSASESSVYYLEEEGNFSPIKLNTLPGVVTALQNKCAGFKELKGTYRFTSSSLVQMISEYSQCKHPGQTLAAPKTYKEKTAQLYLGLQLGLNQGSTGMEENLFAERYFKGGGFRDQLGFSFGIPIELQIGRHLAIQTGLHFLQRTTLRDSVNIRFTFEEFFNEIKFSLTYLDIPLLVQYRFGDEKLQPFVQVGAQVGVPLSRKFSHTPYDPSLNYDTPQHVFQAMGTGLRAGIGLNKSLNSRMKLQVLGQYTRYATFFEHTIPAFIDGDEIKSSVVQVTGGLLWRMGK